jgi:hypothetical protein
MWPILLSFWVLFDTGADLTANPRAGQGQDCSGSVRPITWTGFLYDRIILSTVRLVQDSSAVRRLFVRLAGAVGRQSALHKENSGFATPTVGWHISMFPGYRILFSIWNPYINRFTNHFSIHSQPSYPQKVVLHSITARFCLRPYHFAIWRSFSNLQTWSRDTNWMMTATHCMMGSLRT